jgi:hypothetical protein
MSGRRPNCDSGEPDLWSNGSVFKRPREPSSIDPSPHILLQQTTDRSRFLRRSSNLHSRKFRVVPGLRGRVSYVMCRRFEALRTQDSDNTCWTSYGTLRVGPPDRGCGACACRLAWCAKIGDPKEVEPWRSAPG